MHKISLADFIDFLFNREVSLGGEKWYFQDDFLGIELDEESIVDYCIEIFKSGNELSAIYSESQLVSGIQYLIDSSASLTCFSFFSENVHLKKRLNVIGSMYDFFEHVLDRKCNDVFGCEHANPSSYNFLCYMWWEVLPRHGIPRSTMMDLIDCKILEVIEKILLLKNLACKESALHGLGHWTSEYAEEVRNIIFRCQDHIPTSLLAYANSAMKGDIQ